MELQRKGEADISMCDFDLYQGHMFHNDIVDIKHLIVFTEPIEILPFISPNIVMLQHSHETLIKTKEMTEPSAASASPLCSDLSAVCSLMFSNKTLSPETQCLKEKYDVYLNIWL